MIDYNTRQLVKFIVSNKITRDSSLNSVPRDILIAIFEEVTISSLIDDILIGANRYKVDDRIEIKGNSIKLLEEKYKGGSLARYEDLKLTRDFVRGLSRVGSNRGLERLTVMKHPEGYSQTAICHYCIGKTINLMLEYDSTIGEIIYYICKLALGVSSNVLNNLTLTETEIKSCIDSVLGPWITVEALDNAGFGNYGTPHGMFIPCNKIREIKGYKFQGVTKAKDLLPIRAKKYTTPFKGEHVQYLTAQEITLLLKVGKLSKARGTNLCKTWEDIVKVLFYYSDSQLKDIYSNIKKLEKREKEQALLERQSRPVKVKVSKLKKK
ncbi:hypothetical protein D3C81_06880 [compost metagenome]